MELISREEVIKTIHKYFIKLLDKIPTETDEDGDTVYSDMKTLNSLLTINKWLTKEIKAIPSAEERKEGRWIFDEKGYFFCSECKVKPNSQYATTDYCPNCGAKMVGE